MKFKNNMSNNLVFFTLDQVFNSNLLYCSIYKNWSKEVSIFLYGAINGVNFFKFNYTLFLLRKYTFFLKCIYQKGGSVLIINDDYINRKIFHRSFEKIPYLFYVNNKWVGGTLTNFKKIFNHLLFMMFYCKYYKLNLKQLDPLLDYFKNYFIGISKMRKLPSCLFLLSSDDNFQNYPIIESRSLELPVLGSFNSDINYYIDGGIPINSSNSSSLEFISFLIRNIYLVSLLDKKKLFTNSIKLKDLSFKNYRSYKFLKKNLYNNLFYLTQKLLTIKKNKNIKRYFVYQNIYGRYYYKKNKKSKKVMDFMKLKFLSKSCLFIKNRFLNRNFNFLLREKIPVDNCSIHYYLNLFEHVSIEILKRGNYKNVVKGKQFNNLNLKKKIVMDFIFKTKFDKDVQDIKVLKKYLFSLFRFSYQNYIRLFDEKNCFSCLKVRFKAKKWLKKKFIFKYQMYNKEEKLPFMFTKSELKNQNLDLRYKIFFDFLNDKSKKIDFLKKFKKKIVKIK